MRLLFGAILALIVLAVGAVAFVYSGMYNVAATDDHTAVGKWALYTIMDNSVKASAGDVTVPDLNDSSMIQQGASAYDSLCAACHLKPGLKDTVLRIGLKPTPPNLAEQSPWEPAEQFWIVKHGLKMTGMPAWGPTHNDEELWEMVAFLQKLPELSGQEYNALIRPDESSSEKQAGKGHAQDDGHDHEHGDMSGMMGSSSNEPEAPHDDGHDHEHGDMSGMMGSSSNEPEAPHDDGHDHEHGDMSGMMGSPESGTAEETSGSETDSPSQNEAETDDHYADGHTH